MWRDAEALGTERLASAPQLPTSWPHGFDDPFDVVGACRENRVTNLLVVFDPDAVDRVEEPGNRRDRRLPTPPAGL